MASRADREGVLVKWTTNKGRNDWDVATDIAESMSAEAYNVVLERNSLGKKRRGSAAQTFTGDTFTGYNALFRFVPKAGETSAEVFIVSTDATVKILRVAAGSAASNLTLKDAVSDGVNVRSAVLNNKLYLAFDSPENRLHVFSPDESTSLVRRAGFATPVAPTAANSAVAGSYAATLRYYRVQWRTKSGSTILRQSLLGASVSFTPNGSFDAAVVTQPAVANEGETHWAIYGSEDGDLYYELGEVVIGTTTYSDTEAPADYDTNELQPDEGAFTPFPSVQYILSTGERLIGFGVWETSAGSSVTPRKGRVYFTPVLDTADTDDDERLSNTLEIQGWIDIARNAGAEDRGLGGPIDNNIFVFQSKGIYMLVPTGEASKPYKRIVFHQHIGAVSQESIVMAEDEVGRPALYWLDPVRGPYRYGAEGLQWLGYDVQTLWATVNLAATTRVAAAAYDPVQRCVTFWVATGASNTLSEAMEFFIREAEPTGNGEVRGGWARKAEASASAWRCVGYLPTSIAATMSRALSVYTGSASALRRWNETGSTADAGTNFQAYVTSKAYELGSFHRRKRLGETFLQASAGSGVTIRQTLTRNFGDETARTADVLLTAVGSATRVVTRAEAAALTDIRTMQVTLGDSAAAANAWTLDAWISTAEQLEGN
jgi:hypothetical protein